MKTWGLRAAGWVLMFLSIQLIMRIIYTLGKYWSSPTTEVLLVLTFSAPCLQWTGFPFWESWCPWGWSSSPCACLAPCLSSPSQRAGSFTVHWWLRLWRHSLWSRCSWPAQDFRPKRTSDCLRGNGASRGSGTCEQRCWPARHKTKSTVLLSEVREERVWCSSVPPKLIHLDLLKCLKGNFSILIWYNECFSSTSLF